MTAWWRGPLAGLDFESTAPDPVVARAVTASLVIDVPLSEGPVTHNWLVAVDEPIPHEATYGDGDKFSGHGVTTEHSQAEGEPLAKVITEISGMLAAVWEDQIPLVIYNAPYDLTLLNEERRRCGMNLLRFHGKTTPILDPLILDRTWDKYRKGSRKLGAVCAFYGVELTAAHTSAADTLASIQVARCLGRTYPQKASGPLWQLYRDQQTWFALWAANYEMYVRRLKRQADEPLEAIAAVSIPREWPVQTVHLGEPVPAP
jgi:DNA polymerase-3 subunit epsilon